MSNSHTAIQRGKNGFPFLDRDRTSATKWETDEDEPDQFHLKIAAQGGELAALNLSDEDMDALIAMLQHVRGDSR